MSDTIHVLCISRKALPESLTRLHINGRVACLNAASLQLSAEEAAGVVAVHGATDRVDVEQMHAKTRGWAAGLVLMVGNQFFLGEGKPERPRDIPQGEEATPQMLFAYFAYEILRDLDAVVQACLMQSALLPKMYVGDVNALTGYAESERILSVLQKNNYFTYQLSSRDIVYEYHPLFREFLLARLERSCKPEVLADLKRGAADLLEVRGDFEASVTLREQARDWTGIAVTIARHAEALLTQGRWQLLIQWIHAIPRENVTASPWLMFWDGMARLVVEPVVARGTLSSAYFQFKQNNDATGAYLAWIAIIDSFVFEWSNFTPVLAWVDEFEQLRIAHPNFPSTELEDQANIAMFIGLMYGKPASPNLPIWADHVEKIATQNSDIAIRIKAMPHLSMYYTLWKGDQRKNDTLLKNFQACINLPSVPPLASITWHALTGPHFLAMAEHEQCIASIDQGLAMASAHGIQLWDTVLCCSGAYATITMGNDGAEPYLERMRAMLNPQRKIDSFWYYVPQALWHMARLEYAMARAIFQQSLVTVENTGYFFGETIAICGLARLHTIAGEYDAAEDFLQRGHEVAQLGCNERSAFSVLITEAGYAIAIGDDTRCLRCLRESLCIGERSGIMTHPVWESKLMAQLFAKALEHDIQSEYVVSVIRKHRLIPVGSVSEHWPWPIRIYTLGRFSVVKDGVPLVFSGKTQKKPLEMLRALIAFGGSDISNAKLAKALWPDEDGDVAEGNLTITSHRLRKLLGEDRSIIRQDGQFTLNKDYCWVDIWAFEGMLNHAEHNDFNQQKKGLQLYQGHFLHNIDTPWALSPRERLRSKFLHFVVRVGQWYETRMQWDQAIDLYERGIQAESVSEECYRALMRCYSVQGNVAKAMSAYRRCRDMLSIQLGIKPSAETERLLQTLQSTS
ncbi:MAG: BTAD domain-containing putative transcriptional regulator [Burkholderiaceae bacterium]